MPINYKDLDFNFGKIVNETNPNKDWISTKNNDTDVIQSVKNIILSSDAEVPFCKGRVGLWEKKFEIFTDLSRRLLESDIKRLVNYYEPRCTINSVSVTQNAEILSVKINITILSEPPVQKTLALNLNRTNPGD